MLEFQSKFFEYILSSGATLPRVGLYTNDSGYKKTGVLS